MKIPRSTQFAFLFPSAFLSQSDEINVAPANVQPGPVDCAFDAAYNTRTLILAAQSLTRDRPDKTNPKWMSAIARLTKRDSQDVSERLAYRTLGKETQPNGPNYLQTRNTDETRIESSFIFATRGSAPETIIRMGHSE